MVDAIPFVIVFVVLILSSLVLILGVQVFFILRDFRRTVDKANKVLDDTGIITESVSRPVSSFSSISEGVRMGVSILRSFTKKNKHGKDE